MNCELENILNKSSGACSVSKMLSPVVPRDTAKYETKRRLGYTVSRPDIERSSYRLHTVSLELL